MKLGLAGLFACLTGVGALIKVYLPWTPVPITGQLFFVLASGVVLGKYFGGLSQVIYALVGLSGIPWFAGSNRNPLPLADGFPGLYRGVGGLVILTGPTFGYIIGFIVAAFLIGWAIDSRVSFRRPLYLTPLLSGAIALDYILGALWFYYWWTTGFGVANPRGPLSLDSLLVMAVVPFVPLDLVKAGMVIAVGGLVLPNRPFGGETE